MGFEEEKEKRKRDLLADFRAWERAYHADICRLYRTLQRTKIRATTEADLDKIADLYHRESLWVWQLEILEGHDEEAKFELYKQVMANGYII
jgi:hypothetical protein